MVNPILNASEQWLHDREQMLMQETYARKQMLNQAMNAGMANNAAIGGAGMANNTAIDVTGYSGLTQHQMNNVLQTSAVAHMGQTSVALPRVDPNTHPLLAPSITTLVDMWNLAFGTGWVSRKQMDALDPDWYRYAIDRLKQRGMLESLATADASYFRLVEQHGNR